MKIKTNSVFVVEGQSDKALLNRFVDTEIVVTNGMYVSRETINYLKALEKYHDIIIITDPDKPGKMIREMVTSHLKNPLNIAVSKRKSIRNGKVGVAETDVESLLEIIMPHLSKPIPLAEPLTLDDILKFKQIHPHFQKLVTAFYRLGEVNNKTMIKRLHYLNISKTEIETFIYGQTIYH